MRHIFTLILLSTFLTNVQAQGTEKKLNGILNRPLKNINYISVNGRIGGGFSSPKMASNNNWKVNSGVIPYLGVGFNFVLKNSWGFDLQINQEIASFQVSNEGPNYKTGYMATGAEIGVKKTFAKKPDDTFFFRGAFGYNFLILSSKSGGDDYYSYSSAPNGSNMYILPEIGYQLRLGGGRHLLDFSANYKYSLSDVATSTAIFTDKGNAFEVNTVKMNGSFIGANIRYSYLIKGFEKNDVKNIKVDSHF